MLNRKTVDAVEKSFRDQMKGLYQCTFYHGMEIDKGFYHDGEYSVDCRDHSVLFDTLDKAMAFVDEVTDEIEVANIEKH